MGVIVCCALAPAFGAVGAASAVLTGEVLILLVSAHLLTRRGVVTIGVLLRAVAVSFAALGVIAVFCGTVSDDLAPAAAVSLVAAAILLWYAGLYRRLATLVVRRRLAAGRSPCLSDLRPAPPEASAALPGVSAASVICFSTADWDAPLWTNKQHLMSRLAASGVSVLYMDSLGLRAPGLGAADLSRMLRRVAGWRPYAQPCEPGVLRDSPLVIPLHRYAAVRAVNRSPPARAGCGATSAGTSLHRPVIWAYQPSGGDAYVPGPPRRASSITASTISRPTRASTPRRGGRASAVSSSRADVCIASSMPLVAHLEELGARDVRYWPNPADTESYRAAAAHRMGGPPNERPVIGFVGAVRSTRSTSRSCARWRRCARTGTSG